MKKLIAILAIMGSMEAIQRTVLVEEFTATWCPYCPGAAMGVRDLKNYHKDTVTIIAYHPSSTDPFYRLESYQRAQYYGVSSIPHVWFDGVLNYLGGSSSSSMYPYYKPLYNQRKVINQPIKFICSGTYYPSTRNGTLNIQVINLSSTAVSGYLRIAQVILDTPYTWQNQTHLEWVMRDMLQTSQGTYYSIPAGGQINHSENFSVLSYDNEHEIAFVVFFQNDQNKEVIGARPEFELDSLTWIYAQENKNKEEKPSLNVQIEGKNVKFNLKNISGNLKIYDISGRNIFSKNLSSGIFKLNLEKGIYFYKINDFKGKIVISR
jgi:hypothetical protein